jgi:hypothetical protein
MTFSRMNRARRAADKLAPPPALTDPARLSQFYDDMLTVSHAAPNAIEEELANRDEFTRRRLENLKEGERWDFLFPGKTMPGRLVLDAWDGGGVDAVLETTARMAAELR